MPDRPRRLSSRSRRPATWSSLALSVAMLFSVAACADPAPPAAPGSSGGAAGSDRASGRFPVTVQAGNGDVTISRRPTAIISLSPTATETLFVLDAGDQVIAVDKNSDYPAAAPRTDLDGVTPNVEAIAGRRPDLVVGSGLSPAVVAKFDALDIPVLNEPAAKDLDEAYDQIADLGRATGRVGAATAQIADMKSRIAAIRSAASTPEATYYWELDPTFYSATSTTFTGQVLGLLGLTSIADSASGAATSNGYPQLSAEFILSADPDYVFLADTRCCQQSPATVAKRPGWGQLSAVTGKRVIALDDNIASRWGPRLVDLLVTVHREVRARPLPADR